MTTIAIVEPETLAGPRFAALPPLALYVHIPWCLRKCPYCDFNSHEAKGDAPEAAYVDALIEDLELALPSIWGRKVFSVFIGGGTPSLFSAAAIDRLLAGIRARVPSHRTPRSRWRRIPAPSSAQSSRDFVPRASTGSRSASRASIRSTSPRSAASTTRTKPGARPTPRSRSSAPSTST